MKKTQTPSLSACEAIEKLTEKSTKLSVFDTVYEYTVQQFIYERYVGNIGFDFN